MCELTLLVTSIAVVMLYQGWRNPEWTKCSVHFLLHAFIYVQIRFTPCTISGSHSGTDVCVVDWFKKMYMPWIAYEKFMITIPP